MINNIRDVFAFLLSPCDLPTHASSLWSHDKEDFTVGSRWNLGDSRISSINLPILVDRKAMWIPDFKNFKDHRTRVISCPLTINAKSFRETDSDSHSIRTTILEVNQNNSRNALHKFNPHWNFYSHLIFMLFFYENGKSKAIHSIFMRHKRKLENKMTLFISPSFLCIFTPVVSKYFLLRNEVHFHMHISQQWLFILCILWFYRVLQNNFFIGEWIVKAEEQGSC